MLDDIDVLNNTKNLQGLDIEANEKNNYLNNIFDEKSKAISKENSEINRVIDETKPTAFNNAVEDWKQKFLYNQDSGFLFKSANDVAGKSTQIMQDFDDFVDNWKLQNNLNSLSSDRISEIQKIKRFNILNTVTSFDKSQAKIWAQQEGKTALENAVNNGIQNRNNLNEIILQAKNIEQLTTWQGNLEDLDEDSIKFYQRKNNSDFLSKVLSSKISNRDINSREFFDKFKLQIDENLHEQFLKDIKEVEQIQLTKDWTEQILSKSYDKTTSDNMFEAYKPQMDKNIHSLVKQKLDTYYLQKDADNLKEQNNLLKNKFDAISNMISQGSKITYEDIDFTGLDDNNTKALQHYIENKNKYFDNLTNNDTYLDLKNMSLYDNIKFKNLDLNQYRCELSDEDYLYFKDLQKSDIPVIKRIEVKELLDKSLDDYKNLPDNTVKDLSVVFNRWIDSEIRYAQKEKGKALNYYEIKEIIEHRKEVSLDKKVEEIIGVSTFNQIKSEQVSENNRPNKFSEKFKNIWKNL